MHLFDRVYHLHQIFSQARRPVPMPSLMEKLECSRATVSRMIREMRDYLSAPIEYDRSLNGYRYAISDGEHYQLPGLWFTVSELYALLTLQQFFANAAPGFLDACLAPMRDRVEQILTSRHLGGGEVGQRIRILPMTWRRIDPGIFQSVAGAVLQRLRLDIEYLGRARNECTKRMISPQRLVHYRDNWYLDAWDHNKRALRSFSVDRIRNAQSLTESAHAVPEPELDQHYASAYGIFSGNPGSDRAILRFSAYSARWVADEQWHPQQEGRFLEDGRYELHIPYCDSCELVMDILKHGEEVEVVGPTELRERVVDRLKKTLKNYL
jgi:predicted DNA-binding transcriptional regulator YafY